MSKFTTKKLKVLAALTSVGLFATAFTPGGCTLNLDQALLDQLGNIFPGGAIGPGQSNSNNNNFDDHDNDGDDNGNGNGHDNDNGNGNGHDNDNDWDG